MPSKMRHGLLISLVVLSLIVVSFRTSYADTTNYIYDELNRLIRVEYEDGTKIIYTYDEMGNRSEVYVGQYTLTVNVVGDGTVTKNPDQPIYSAGTSVTLTAINGSEMFSEWSGDLTGNTNPAIIVINGDKSVIATFVTPENWLQGWTYRKAVTLSRASGAVTNYQMRLPVGETAGASGGNVDCNGHVRADFNDLRFTTRDGITLLDYWIESITGTTPNRLATVWVEFDSIGTSPGTFYMYYGNPAATSASSHINTMIKADNGATGNFIEATSGGASITHVSGYYKITESTSTDAGIAGNTLPNLNFAAHMDTWNSFSGSNVSELGYFSLHDSASVSGCIGNVASFLANTRFFINRYSTNHATLPDDFAILYIDPNGMFHYWTGSSWTTSATYIGGTTGAYSVRIYSDGTNICADILQNGTSILTSPASIAVSSVKSFSNGYAIYFGDSRTDAYDAVYNIDNYYIRQYVSPEPTWGSWGVEEAN